jgi:serine/threonine protein kinase
VSTSGGGMTGQWLGDYQLEGLLGVGGMAEVYQARDAVLGREVAIKVLPPALAADPGYVERFRNEAREVGALNHPNIVPVHHFAEQGPYLYLVMPLMRESLRDRLLRGVPLPIVDAVQIAVQILSGLAAAHARGIVHRDVKPENILLDENGVAMLTDFGIARRVAIRRVTGGPTLAGTGLPVGTPQYMAPEQLRGEDLDQRADIYALGSVLYEMLTGLPPHVAETPYGVASLALTAPIAPPATKNPEIWPQLEQVMLKALSRKTSDRYANAASFAEALQDALLALGIELMEPASLVKRSYVKYRTSQPLAKSATGSANGSSGEQASGWSNTPRMDPAEPPTIPSIGAPPAGIPPRWPPSNRPRDDGAGGGGPGRRILVFALIAAVVLLGTCGAALYAMGLFSSGGTTQATATATQAESTATEITPPTSTPTLETTATSIPAPTRTPAPTNMPSSPTLTVSDIHVYESPTGSGVCTGPQQITNNGPQADGWIWVVTNGPLPPYPAFKWGFGSPSGGGIPQDSTSPPGTHWTVFLQIDCSAIPPSGFHLHLQDDFGHNFPASDVIFKQGP